MNNTVINNTHIGFNEYIPGNRDDNTPQYDDHYHLNHLFGLNDGDVTRIGPNNRKILLEHIKLVTYKKDGVFVPVWDSMITEDNSLEVKRYDHPRNINTKHIRPIFKTKTVKRSRQ